jgi:hypothetical protein
VVRFALAAGNEHAHLIEPARIAQARPNLACVIRRVVQVPDLGIVIPADTDDEAYFFTRLDPWMAL